MEYIKNIIRQRDAALVADLYVKHLSHPERQADKSAFEGSQKWFNKKWNDDWKKHIPVPEKSRT